MFGSAVRGGISESSDVCTSRVCPQQRQSRSPVIGVGSIMRTKPSGAGGIDLSKAWSNWEEGSETQVEVVADVRLNLHRES